MPASRAVPGRAAVLGIVVAAVLGLPAGAAAATALPADQTARALDGQPITAIVGDIDGDGTRELVTLGPRRDDPVHLAVEVLEEGPDGRVDVVGSAPLARMASVTEQLSGLPRPDEHNLLQARVDEPARLIAWHDHGRERVLAVAIGTLRNARACCLSIWMVERSRDGIGLGLMTDTMRSANQVRAVDLDADGTDELVVTEPPEDSRPNAVTLSVLRWTGRHFADQSIALRPAATSLLLPLGDSDGLPGDELGLVTAIAPGFPTSRLHRIALDTRGRLRVDTAKLPFTGNVVPISVAGPDVLVLGDDDHPSVTYRWPAGNPFRRVDGSRWTGVPLAAIGRGASATVLKVREARLLDLFGPRLGTIRIGMSGTAAADRFRRAGIAAYSGPLPGGTSAGEPAFIFRGLMVTARADGRPGGAAVVNTSAMPGVAPVGLFGARLRLLAMARSVTPGLGFSFDATRSGGQLSQPAGGLRSARLVVAEAAIALAAEADEGLVLPEPSGPVRVEAGQDGPVLLAGGPFSLPVSGPPGTTVEVRLGDTFFNGEVPRTGVVDMRVGTDTLDDGDEVRLSLLAITPAGQGYGGSWTLAMHTRPPSLSAVTPFAPLSFDVRLSGRTAPDASVAVDGEPVRVAADGRFEAPVSAGLWPRDVQIEATDPLGNRSSTTVSVVALLDYRQLPWIPIVALLTVMAGIVLYLRAPRARPQAASGPITDATLEDLE